MGIIGGYDLHLYCDNPDCPDKHDMPAQLMERDKAETFRSARKMGWKFPRWLAASGSGSKWRMNDDGTMPCYCPKCRPVRSRHL